MSQKEPVDLSKVTQREFPYIKKLSWEQEEMVIKLYKHKKVFVDAIAGSGKTTILTQAMKVLLERGIINRIYYVVFPVQEESLGFLPGGVGDKVKEYVVPFMQALRTAGIDTNQLDVTRMCDETMDCDYKVVPHTFLRGRTLEDVGVILDETQNGTVAEIKKTLTRITDSCYTGVVGHTGQIDINKSDSGFSNFIQHFKNGKDAGVFTDIGFAELTHDFRGDFSKFADQCPE